MFRWTEFARGTVLYLLPIIIFILSVTVYQNALIIAVAVTWIFFSMTYKIMTLPDDSAQANKKIN
ncbi:MAG: hypothetical protein M1535_05675 [Candidatus Thermoplasmatota archaeon]|jgi:hypothetical protein|nr:hypothetical protein [Candidatus Thermoplasmatota archaeon]